MSAVASDDAAFDAVFQAQIKAAQEKFPVISVDTLYKRTQTQEDFVILDIRDKVEVDRFGAPVWGQYYHISRGRLELYLNGSGLSREDEVLVLCRNGMRAFLAAFTLEAYGFESIAIIDKGMDAWVGRDYPTMQP
jgi:rhodanese-related sulfurtransferase